jgi:hypothetical protein
MRDQSLRIYAIHADDSRPTQAAVDDLLATEQTQGLRDLSTDQAFQPRADRIKNDLLADLAGRGTRFTTAVPELQLHSSRETKRVEQFDRIDGGNPCA